MAGTQRKHSRHFRPSGRKPRRAPEAPVEAGKAQQSVATPEPLPEPIAERTDEEIGGPPAAEPMASRPPAAAEVMAARRPRYDRDRRSAAPPGEGSTRPSGRAPIPKGMSAVSEALEHAQHIIDELKSATDEMEIVLELLEEAEREKTHDEREISALQKALERIQRFKGPPGRDRERSGQ